MAESIDFADVQKKGDRATANIELQGRVVGVRKLRLILVRQAGSWKIDKVGSR